MALAICNQRLGLDWPNKKASEYRYLEALVLSNGRRRSPAKTGEQRQKSPVYPGLFPAMFPGIGVAVNSGLCRLLSCKLLIYQ